jgi:hypothetical protein
MMRSLAYYEQAFAPLRQGDLDMGTPAAEPPAPLAQPEIPFTYLEAHRHACEVRYVQNLTPDARETFLQHVAKKRGEEAGQRLREDVLK